MSVSVYVFGTCTILYRKYSVSIFKCPA